MDVSSASLFSPRKREAVIQGGTRGIDHLMWRRTQGDRIIKGWEESAMIVQCTRVKERGLNVVIREVLAC